MEYNKEILEELIFDKKLPYVQIGKMYNVSGNSIKKAATKLGISLPRRRSINSCERFGRRGIRKNNLVFRIPDDAFINIIKTSDSWTRIGEKLGYTNSLSSNVKIAIEKRCLMLGINVSKCLYENEAIWNKTKGEIFKKGKNWQAARSSIQHLARREFFGNNPSPKCAICGYDKHVEVAHIKPVSGFSDEATMREINSFSNLIGLCPNHHWEFDNGLLKL